MPQFWQSEAQSGVASDGQDSSQPTLGMEDATNPVRADEDIGMANTSDAGLPGHESRSVDSIMGDSFPFALGFRGPKHGNWTTVGLAATKEEAMELVEKNWNKQRTHGGPIELGVRQPTHAEMREFQIASARRAGAKAAEKAQHAQLDAELDAYFQSVRSAMHQPESDAELDEFFGRRAATAAAKKARQAELDADLDACFQSNASAMHQKELDAELDDYFGRARAAAEPANQPAVMPVLHEQDWVDVEMDQYFAPAAEPTSHQQLNAELDEYLGRI